MRRRVWPILLLLGLVTLASPAWAAGETALATLEVKGMVCSS
jgi:hypothetical protein